MGIINGMADGTYDPEGTITRGQFMKLLTALFGLSSDNPDISVTDVPSDYWVYPYLAEGFARGIITQDELDGGQFRPEEAVDRATMALWMVRALASKAGAARFPSPTPNFWPPKCKTQYPPHRKQGCSWGMETERSGHTIC